MAFSYIVFTKNWHHTRRLFTHLTSSAAPPGSDCHHPHVTDEDTETQVTLPVRGISSRTCQSLLALYYFFRASPNPNTVLSIW